MSVSRAFFAYLRDIPVMLFSICCGPGREEGKLLGWVTLKAGLLADKVLRDTCTHSHNQLSEKVCHPLSPRCDDKSNSTTEETHSSCQLPVRLSPAKQTLKGQHLLPSTQPPVPQANLPDRFLVVLSHPADS